MPIPMFFFLLISPFVPGKQTLTPHARTQTLTSYTRHTMTQGEAFMICMKSICLFQQLRHQHSTSKLFQRGLRKIDLHPSKTDRYLFIYFTEHSLHDGELDTSKIWLHTVCLFTLFVTSIRSVDQQRNSPPKTLTSLSNRRHWGWQVTGLLAECYRDSHWNEWRGDSVFKTRAGKLWKMN